MTARCHEGHDSTELDYCSVCGGAMPSGRALPTSGSPGASPAACPACGEERADKDARYCEVCRYDFVGRRPGPPPAGASSRVPAPPAPPAPAVVASPVAAAPSPRTHWQLVVEIDVALDTEPDAASPCPTGVPAEIVAFDREILVGRRDDLRDIRPDIPIVDPGASRRHAKFVLDAEGSPALQDLASTNGTKLNDKETAPGSRTRLDDGDAVTLGRWTRITVRRVP